MNPYTIVNLINTLVNFYSTLIVIWCLLTWIPMKRDGLLADIAAAIGSLVNPYLNLFRKMMPSTMGIDFSPVIAVLALTVAERLLISIIL